MRVAPALVLSGILLGCGGGHAKPPPSPPISATAPPDAATADAAAGEGEQTIAQAMAILCESTWDGKAEEYAMRRWIPDELAAQITNDDVTKLIGAIVDAERKAELLRDYLADNSLLDLDCPLEFRLESQDEMRDPDDGD
jgi:hypothetical protein